MNNRFVLIVDDENDIRNSLLRSLRNWSKKKGLFLETADSGRAALDFLTENHKRTAVILSDQKMPELTGAEFLIEVAELYPDIVSVILTGHASTSDISSFLQAGIFAFLEKPWDRETLVDTMDKAFSAYENKLKDEKHKKILTEELNLASEFADTYMKPVLPESDMLEFSYSTAPANSLPFSGDYLDVIDMKNGRYLILLGDVTGHGMKASFVIAMLKSIINSDFFSRSLRYSQFNLTEYISLLNKSVCKKLHDFPETFLALSACLINEKNGELIFCNAGQPPLIVLTESGVKEVGLQNMVLGVAPSTIYNETSYQLERGDVAFFCTDGLYPSGKEVRYIDKSIFHELLNEKRDSDNITRKIIDSVRRTEMNIMTKDDITAFSIRFMA